ncbi:MAG: hypothetical protein NTV51_08875 [Verrucomicrobia bacterium]|nr:hypothetical protein [Verrucomicrobiota bacterium]
MPPSRRASTGTVWPEAKSITCPLWTCSVAMSPPAASRTRGGLGCWLRRRRRLRSTAATCAQRPISISKMNVATKSKYTNFSAPAIQP